MSLDISLMVTKPTEVFEYNITHNLVPMAREAGLYHVMWHPEMIWIEEPIYAYYLIDGLAEGLKRLKADPDRFIKLNPSNGWGSFQNFVVGVECYLAACKATPNALVNTST